jgi:cytochrome c
MKKSAWGGAFALAVIVGIATTPAISQVAGDREAGADVFDIYCSDCHSVSPRGTNKKGPSLFHVLGRRAGTVPGFAYSPQLHASGLVWTPDRIAAYLANPKAVAPAGIMKFKGLPRPQDRANVIAFLANPD